MFFLVGLAGPDNFLEADKEWEDSKVRGAFPLHFTWDFVSCQASLQFAAIATEKGLRLKAKMRELPFGVQA